MRNSDRFKIRFGPYVTPPFQFGDVVMDEIRGEVTIVELSDSPIPWPIGKRGRIKSLVLYADLIKAVEKEAGQVICHWWGVSYFSATKWRKSLGVERANKGTRAVRRDIALGEAGKIARAAAYPTLRNPDRIAKIAAANRGQKRTKSTIAKMRRANTGRKRSQESIDKQMAARQRKKSSSAHGGRPWSRTEDAMLRKLPVKEVATKTGRTVTAVYHRRRMIGLARPRSVQE